jgi:hypothetical protein
VRLGLVRELGRHDALQARLVSALGEGVDHLDPDWRPTSGARVDYVLDIDIDVEGSGRASNFLACFPGFVVFAPSWYQLRWDYDVVTHVRVRRGGSHALVKDLAILDQFVARFTPPGVLVGSYIGFGGLLVAPLLAAPLVTGIVVALDDWDPHAFSRLLARDDRAGWQWAQHVAAEVRRAIDADLGFE